MRIGVLKNFGLKKRDGSLFGFLADGAEGELYFHERGIAPGSGFKEKSRRDSLVVYEVRRFGDGRAEAFSVRLLEELDRREQLLLFRECFSENREAEQELLRSHWRRPKRADRRVRTGVVTKLVTDRFGTCFGFLKSAGGEKEFRFDRYSFSPGLYRFYCRRQSLKGRRGGGLALEDCHVVYEERWTGGRWQVNKVWLPEELSEDQLLALYQKWRDGNQGAELEWLFDFTRAPLEGESDEGLSFLVLMMKAGNYNVSRVLAQRPELLRTSPEVCGCIDSLDITDPSLRPAETDEQAAFLARHVRKKDAWHEIVRKLPDDLVLGCPQALAAVDPGRAVSLIARVDGTSDREAERARLDVLLTRIDWGRLTEADMAVIRPLLERESNARLASLVKRARAERRSAAALIRCRPELLWTDPEVCACVEWEDIGNLPLDQWIPADESACRHTLLAKFDFHSPARRYMDTARPLWEREPDEFIISLITRLKAEGKTIAHLLAWKPALLWTSPEVCACAEKRDIENLPSLAALIQTDEQAAFLAEHAGDDAWDSIAPRLSGRVLLHCRRAMDCVTKSQISALLAGIDWTDASEENLEDHRPLLAKLHWNTVPDEITTAAASLHAKGMALKLCWWQRMTGSMKVRLLMYLSDFAEDERTERRWFQELQEIRRWEAEEGNRLVCALLQFFAGIYMEAGAPYRNNFLKAHSMLMEYITDCFTREIDVTPELSGLLERCRDRYGSHFCDGRSWRKQNRVYCPERGRSCPRYEDMDLTKTAFRTARRRGGEANYRNLSFMDFLLNVGGIPELSHYDVGIKVKEEYPFRISAYVNSLVRLRPHMKCSHCGELFHPKFEYARLVTARLPVTVFHCAKAGQKGEHDQNVYLNFCYRCHEIIDSRECSCREKLSDSGEFEGVISMGRPLPDLEGKYGQYLCMHCGGSRNVVLQNSTVCPKCGCDEPASVHRTPRGRIVCEECGYHSSEFYSRFEKDLYKSQNPSLPGKR